MATSQHFPSEEVSTQVVADGNALLQYLKKKGRKDLTGIQAALQSVSVLGLCNSDRSSGGVDRFVVISQPVDRLRVFVSSTIKECAEERAVVRDAIRSINHEPILFEEHRRPAISSTRPLQGST